MQWLNCRASEAQHFLAACVSVSSWYDINLFPCIEYHKYYSCNHSWNSLYSTFIVFCCGLFCCQWCGFLALWASTNGSSSPGHHQPLLPSVFLFSLPLPPTILTCPNSPFFGPNFSPSHCFQCSAPGEDLSSRHQALHQGLQGHTNYHILVQSALGSAGVVGLYYCSFQASAAAAAARAATTSNHQDEDRGTQLATTTRPRIGLGDVCAPWRPFCLCQ